MMDSEIKYCDNCAYSIKLSGDKICLNKEVTLTLSRLTEIEAKYILLCKALGAKHVGSITADNPRRLFRDPVGVRWL